MTNEVSANLRGQYPENAKGVVKFPNQIILGISFTFPATYSLALSQWYVVKITSKMTVSSTWEEIIELEYDYDKFFSKYHDKSGTNLWNHLIFTVSVEVHVALSLAAVALFLVSNKLLGRHFWKPRMSLLSTDLRAFFAFIIRIPPLLKLSFLLYSI